MAKKNENASKGGRARANRLTKQERSQISREAASVRWEKQGKGKVHHATHEGVLAVGDLEIPCAVLVDGTRVLSESGIVTSLGLYRSGAVHVRSQGGDGERLPLFVANKNIVPFVDDELVEMLMKPVWYFPVGGGTRNRGTSATLFPKICDVWLRARDAGVLSGNKRQEQVAIKADILMRGLAETGIVALVDEATGYQRAREQDALAKILEQFIAKELQKWISTFPLRFYELICEVRAEPIERAKTRPQYLGTITNDLVYERLAPGVLEQLKNSNPVVKNGGRKHKHHQFLTPDMGHPKLREHLAKVITVLDVARLQGLGWEGFKKLLDNTVPKQPDAPLFRDQDDL